MLNDYNFKIKDNKIIQVHLPSTKEAIGFDVNALIGFEYTDKEALENKIAQLKKDHCVNNVTVISLTKSKVDEL